LLQKQLERGFDLFCWQIRPHGNLLEHNYAFTNLDLFGRHLVERLSFSLLFLFDFAPQVDIS